LLSNKIECLSNRLLIPNPTLSSINPTPASNPLDLNVAEDQTSNLLTLSYFPNITQVQLAAVPAAVVASPETQVPRTELVQVQGSATTLSPSKTQALCNEQVQFQVSSPFPSPNETQASHNDQVQLTVAVPSAPVKKSVKMRPGSLNTARQAFIPLSISPFKLYFNIPILGACVL
jgi:hypothetical protein